jgi:uracil-DNA glycosylase
MNPRSDLERYLEQQQQLIGETLYFEPQSIITNNTSNTLVSASQPEQTEDISLTNSQVNITDTSPTKEVLSLIQPQRMKNFIAPITPKLVDSLGNNPTWINSETLVDLNASICECMNCSLGATRTKFVFGTGNPNADVVVIGEAPGADEDAKGEPFVGRAGQLLTKILEAINFTRDEVYICNILKCRPPENRRPLPSEVEQCEPYLYKQLEIIQPKLILALGLTAIETLMKKKYKMGEIRGQWFDYHGARLLVTYHPAALLRNPEWKKATWEDVQLLRRTYDNYIQTGEIPSADILMSNT